MQPPRLRLFALLAALSLLCPPLAHAAPPATREQMAAFEAGFTAGQASFDSGEYLAAVELWITAAGRLPEVTAHREHRLAVYQYVADAYARGLADETEVEPLGAAVAALDAYCEGFTRSYGTETPLDPKIVRILADLRGRLDAAVAIRELQAAPQEGAGRPPPITLVPAPKPWKGLTIGGGILLGLGLGAVALAATGAARGQYLETRFDDPINACDLERLQGHCADLHADGERNNAVAIAGTILAPLLLGGGAALLVMGLKRRPHRTRHALAPALAPSFIGLRLGGRF
ncbi:MAG: hypothetical protein H0T76_25205 [Nannocystis sp.]|nr:hypothetical protein [Nannocystis sp.]MBA3549792.1 hypothetical protein [Nannocystis sp.]